MVCVFVCVDMYVFLLHFAYSQCMELFYLILPRRRGSAAGRESTLFENQFGFSRTSKYCWLASSRRKGEWKIAAISLGFDSGVTWRRWSIPCTQLAGTTPLPFSAAWRLFYFRWHIWSKVKNCGRAGHGKHPMVRFFLCPNFGARLLHVSQTPSLTLYSLSALGGGNEGKAQFPFFLRTRAQTAGSPLLT